MVNYAASGPQIRHPNFVRVQDPSLVIMFEIAKSLVTKFEVAKSLVTKFEVAKSLVTKFEFAQVILRLEPPVVREIIHLPEHKSENRTRDQDTLFGVSKFSISQSTPLILQRHM